MHRHHLLNTGNILILPTLKDILYLVNLIFELRVGYHVVSKLIVGESQKPMCVGQTPTRAFCPTSARALCLTDGPKAKMIPTTRHCILFGLEWYTVLYTCL